MKQTFSTGEVAKLCNVSIRTVQYYDKENIVKPSELSEGGRRIYSQDDLQNFRCVCLYKSLGFLLEEIKTVMQSQNPYELLAKTIVSQKEKIDEKVQLLIHEKERLLALYEQIEQTGKVEVESIEDMENLLVKKRTHRKTDIITYIFMGCYILILLIIFPIANFLSGIAPFIMYGIAAMILIGLIYYHAEVNAYVCTECRQKFTIGLWNDMVSLNGMKKGKYLKCPHCNHRGWFKDTYRD
ncbi:MerR family transcriptional regulator [Alkaliphilus serpentinus]|nr:MerR family transcriptional regulator [Alkaliphilus serpentinus]